MPCAPTTGLGFIGAIGENGLGAWLLVDWEIGVPADFPDVAVGIAEIAGIAAPFALDRARGDLGPGALGLVDQLIHLIVAANIVGKGDAFERPAKGNVAL